LLSSALLMRAGLVHLVTLPLLLTYCGSKQDLLIGEVAPITTDGGSNVVPGAGVGGETSGSGGAQGGSNAMAGATAEGGSAGADSMAGASGTPEDCTEGEEPPVDALIHRWSFDGTGTTVVDSIGGADGTVQGGAMLDGSGVLALAGNRDGQPDQYVDLQNNLISGLSQVTIVAWTTWQGGAGYQRIFDFGISDMGEQQGGSGRSYLAVMPSTGFANGTGLGGELAAPGLGTQQLPSSADIEDKLSVVALSVRSANSVELFLDGKSLLRIPTAIALSDIDDKNAWIGESQWSKDHCYHGTFDEFRIYSAALNACQLRTIISRGQSTP
jgi:hypothetical protein